MQAISLNEYVAESVAEIKPIKIAKFHQLKKHFIKILFAEDECFWQ